MPNEGEERGGEGAQRDKRSATTRARASAQVDDQASHQGLGIHEAHFYSSLEPRTNRRSLRGTRPIHLPVAVERTTLRLPSAVVRVQGNACHNLVNSCCRYAETAPGILDRPDPRCFHRRMKRQDLTRRRHVDLARVSSSCCRHRA
ncbi:putative leader peptide [Streptomyces leeuwenhoekii]|uniref:putative leader peptide n=1 Tax=Streptomyces leeuwenhoekii TaxID=1437453 RepID=UPI003BF47859